MAIAVVHCVTATLHDRALRFISLVAGQFLRGDVVAEESERGRVIVAWNEMTGLGHREVLKIVTCAPVATIDKLSIYRSCILHPVDLS